MKKQLITLALAALMGAGGQLSAQETAEQTKDAGYEKRMEWFSEAKLGIFIHWGIYAVNGVSESWSFFNNYLP